ncbi:hypothetical protein H7J06_13955 [Mycobacterium hodleri]|uniref:hypothetical protein n=1 Tax=Mycolicibacterium hodleri TaxID=49897 RepID=UPI0021F30118|nr:hypothetical protein [Mycolicibacterium hodleri]MCV7134090.1 hypothetical protein [Mycolicibacterium hodleri]
MAIDVSLRSATDDQVRTATRWSGGLWLAATVGMLCLERAMHATGGPGIIAFELAGSERRVTYILDSWGPKGVAAARASLRLDFGYMCTYGVFAALLAEGAERRLARRRSKVRLARWAQVACLAAVAADAREGVALLNILHGRDRQAHATRARRAALTKFGLLSAVLLYWAISHAPERHSGS